MILHLCLQIFEREFSSRSVGPDCQWPVVPVIIIIIIIIIIIMMMIIIIIIYWINKYIYIYIYIYGKEKLYKKCRRISRYCHTSFLYDVLNGFLF